MQVKFIDVLDGTDGTGTNILLVVFSRDGP